MNPGEKYTHRHLPGLTCTISRLTEKGAQVQQQEAGRKPKTAHYHRQDFSDQDPARAIWEADTPPLRGRP